MCFDNGKTCPPHVTAKKCAIKNKKLDYLLVNICLIFSQWYALKLFADADLFRWKSLAQLILVML